MDLAQIIDRFRGVVVTVVTTNPTATTATGEVLDGSALQNTLALKLTAAFAGFPIGATVFFNVVQIVAIG